MKNNKEDNKLIAEFMGLILVDGYYKNSYEIMSFFPHLDYIRKEDNLEFDYNWNWLMTVIEKISKDYGYSMPCGPKGFAVAIHCEDHYTQQRFNHTNCDTLIEAVYKSVVQFIKQYNETKQRNEKS